MEILQWIDNKLSNIEKTDQFKHFFSQTEIENIEGTNYLFNPNMGIDIVMDDQFVINTIHLFSGKGKESKQYLENKPFNIDFSLTRSDVCRILGNSNRQGGGYNDIFGYVPSWDKYYLNSYTLHFQYLGDETIELITIGSLSSEEYLNSDLNLLS